MKEPFSIFIVGNGKYGKSTLLNALIGKNVVKVGEIPKTWKIDVFKKDKESKYAYVRYKDGSIKKLTKNETYNMLAEEERKAAESEEKAAEIFEREKVKYLGNKAALKELNDAIEKKCLYKSNIVEVIWLCYEGGLLNNFQLVDTPGLNQELLDGELKPAFDDYLNKADGVLWILNANRITAKDAYDIMNSSSFSTDKNVIGIVNSIDEVGDIDGDRVKAVMHQAK